MDCRTARVLLELAHPHVPELAADDTTALAAHVLDCPECGPLAQIERHLDDRLGQAMRAVPIPEDLCQRLQSRLRAGRSGWYRRRATGFAAAAAVLLVTSLGAWYWFASHKTVVSAPDYNDSIGVLQSKSESELENSLYKTYGLRTVLPRELNYACLESLNLGELNGRLVPSLHFTCDQGSAEVKILSAHQFNLPQSFLQSRADSGGITVMLRPYADNREYAYLVTSTGRPIDDWLYKAPPDVN